MKNSPVKTKAQLVDELKGKVAKLQSELVKITEPMNIEVQLVQKSFSKLRDPKAPDRFGLGNFLLLLDVTANKETLYIPISIASGRKSAGFIYEIDGTATATSTAEVSCKGEGTTTVTSGSVSYRKIPIGKTATFKMLFGVKGRLGREYKVVVSKINYKLNPTDLRYKGFIKEINTDTLTFH